ncbi:MAG: ArnT family glycosyltransferase [Flavipsychrobacter sp.]
MFRNFNRVDARFLLLVSAAHAIFYLIAWHYKHIYNGDSHEYIYMATNIKNTGWFYAGNPVLPVKEEYMTLRPPGYPLFLCFIYLFVLNNWIVLLVQNLVSIFNIYLLRHTITQLGYLKRYDWLLLAFILLFPSQFVNANIIAPDILLQSCIVAYFYFFVAFIQRKHWRYVLGMGLILALGAFIKPVLYPVVYLHAVGILVYASKHRDALMRAAICAIVPLLLIVGYGYVNYERTGKFHFSSTQSFNAIFYYYNFYKDEYGVDMAEQFLHAERSHVEELPTFLQRYDYANARGMQLLKQNFSSYLPYHIGRSLLVFMDPGKGELDMFVGLLTLSKLYDVHNTTGFFDTIRDKGYGGLEDYMARNPTLPIAAVVLFFNLLRLAGFVLFLFSKRYSFRLRAFIATLVGYFVFIAGPIANTRYFIPVSLIVIGTAVLGYQYILQRQRNKAIIATAGNL